MRNLAARIERLEEVYSPAEVIVIMLTHFGEGEIKGWKGEGIYIARKPGESEEALACRAAAEARAHCNQNPSLVFGHIVLQMERQDVLKPEPGPERGNQVFTGTRRSPNGRRKKARIEK